MGPSGSGKSSAVQAGLIPHLRREAPHLLIASMQPGAQPFAELEAALNRCSADRVAPSITQLRASEGGFLDAVHELLQDDARSLLLVVDQFEEVFTLVEPDEATTFLGALLHAAQDPASACTCS